ncbi:MAG: PEP-CTERM sorting domain-containing protein, partial [Tepidisphaerales bacterium]
PVDANGFGPKAGSDVPPAGYAGLSSKSGGAKGTTAKLLSGNGTAPVTEAWRNATTAETTPGNAIFGVGFHASAPTILSDVMDINGVTGTYAMSMTYAPPPNEAVAAAAGEIELAYFDNTGHWVPAEPNAHMVGGIHDPIPTDFSSFAVGTYGVNIDQHVVWEVLDHNSFVAVVPEPATIGLLGLSALGLTIRRRRRTA